MGGGVSRWRRAAKTIGFPCASFSNGASSTCPPKTTAVMQISCPAVNLTPDNTKASREKQESTTVADKNVCAICLEPLSCGGGDGDGNSEGGGRSTLFTAQCSHSFHFLCISSNVRHGNETCPICRAQWAELPRELKAPPSHRQSDPILRIIDDSIATSRVNRRSSVSTTRYDDDDPVEPATTTGLIHPCLQFSLITTPTSASSHHHHRRHLLGQYPCVHMMPLHHQCQFTSSPVMVRTSPPNGQPRAWLSVRLSPQRAMDVVLVASPNGPHMRLLKHSMALVVFFMRAVDRLSIVICSATATRAFPLRRMSSHGKRAALQVIDRLSFLVGADPMEGIQKAVKILEDRTHRNSVSCILHLSDAPTRADVGGDLHFPVTVHRFHVGFGFGMTNGFVMHEFEEFLARLIEGVVRDTQLRIGDQVGLVRLGELRGGEERRIAVDLVGDCGFVKVGYSYVEGGTEAQLRTGEVVVEFGEKGGRIHGESGNDERDLSVGGRRSSCVEQWDYLDPFMARRWAKHLQGYKAQG
ncbi:E3 ubiquitin-protein ligase WAV3-like isoform X1 [Typha angustifolia]|uniref:E3 ubiquitin-protein ligase WAV3-like isoform X1 n=1 Tax=Typha angustifolia TaxID=59011 RepID=UPI003C2B8867